uniref:Uncharacterized protein n=1 Tax=Chrysoporthe austroafricana TaxID=354353 RepID=A0A191MWS4_9PEZI|nr:hypothetical protein [Chrysoporthe austroafricana]AMX22126.1 hypothetical protein [Chrysoporthe austroafricana]
MIFMLLKFTIWKILDDRLLLYLVISVLQFLYYKYTNDILLDGVDGELNEFVGRRYTPYNPNYVATSQGYKIELDSNPVYELDGKHFEEQGGRRIYNYNPREYYRVGHPSHYHSSYNKEVIEPTRSQIEDNGYYYVSSSVHRTVLPQRTSNFKDANTCKLSAYKDKFKGIVRKLDENLQKDYNKRMDRKDNLRILGARSPSRGSPHATQGKI